MSGIEAEDPKRGCHRHCRGGDVGEGKRQNHRGGRHLTSPGDTHRHGEGLRARALKGKFRRGGGRQKGGTGALESGLAFLGSVNLHPSTVPAVKTQSPLR